MNKRMMSIVSVICFMASVLFFLYHMGIGEESFKMDSRRLGQLCIAQLYPAADFQPEEKKEEKLEITETKVTSVKETKESKAKVDNSKPQVIIYHTHSSESYQPYTEGNFHRQGEEGTVREVGTVMAEELNKLGVSVVHDKTIHDSPSYNQSYERSMETITSLMKKYPSAEIIIDLHRDAAAYTGNVGETITIDGEKVAKYKLVIGQANGNYSSLMAFAKKVNNAAEELYPGFSGRILEKEYNYNEYIADNYLLLEVGNNQNNIKEVRRTGKYFAHVIEKILEDGNE